MKSFVVALCMFAVAAATLDKDAQVLNSHNEQSPEGNFNNGFQLDNGVSIASAGVLRTNAKGEPVLAVSGGQEYISPEGVKLELTYTADENGYVPQAAYLPTPPPTEPIPEYIQRSLEWIAAHPYTEVKKSL